MNPSKLPSGLVIREYRPEDREACLDVYRSNEDLLPPALELLYEEWLEMGTSYHLVIEREGKILACGGLEIDGDRNANSMVYGKVRRENHRQGLGTLLMLSRLALVPGDHDPAYAGLETSVGNELFFLKLGFERLNNPVARYAGASYFVDMGLWLSAAQKEEMRALLLSLPVTFEIDFAEADGLPVEAEQDG
jgi:N-acetylglutamate synthase-like GNAT family acetyltransferase